MHPATRFTLLVTCALSSRWAAHAADAVDLVAGGKAAFTIAVAGEAADLAKPESPERYAAAELSKFLQEITGVPFDVKPLAEAGPGPKILVGPDAAAAIIAPAQIEALGKEGYIIRAAGADLAIAGGRPRGTLYGVYSFLEDRLGCRWFTPEVSRIPKSAAPKVSLQETRCVPPLEYRATDYPNSRDGDWAVRNKMNGTQTQIDPRRGGKIDYHHFVHTFNDILNPKDHFKEHPEFFSEVDGKRISEGAQLCVSNPEVLKIATETVRRWMREAPRATIFSVSQNDWINPCACPACKKAFEDEGQSWCGPLLRFVNGIAASLKDEFPDKAVDTLAYQYTRKPPTQVKPLPNVIVRLCSIECCFSHPLESPAEQDGANAAFVGDIQRWGKISERLYIWDYVIDYAHSIMPFPNLRSLKPNIRFFIQNGVKGIYEEADYFTRGGEMAELRTWIIAKTLWNPDYDTDAAIAEFLEGYYEEAGAPIGEYLKLIHDKATTEKIHFPIWAGTDSPLFTPEVIDRSEKLFDAAEAKVSTKPAVLHRVQVARLPMTYVRIEKLSGAVRAATAPVPEDKALLKALLDRFEAAASKEGVSMVSEGRRYDDWRAAVRKITE